MLRRSFNPRLSYRAVAYLRMSSELQNKTSPDQQLRQIRQRIDSLGYDWTIIREFRDEAISGRTLNRPGFKAMMAAIRSGELDFDLILVDTLERFGRVDDIPQIRKRLDERHGVLVLTADSGFADPRNAQGKIIGMFETLRATEHGRILASDVMRGKLEAVESRHWPGGKPPFGYKLEAHFKRVKGRDELDFARLVPDPQTAWIIRRLFEKAASSGWGGTRLARFLNEQADIPDDFKVFRPSTVTYWLDHEIYRGELVWSKVCTGIVDDRRVTEANDPNDIVRVEGFCDPIVPPELWRRVQQLRNVRRSQRGHDGDGVEDDAKLIRPTARGMSLKYALSGLVFCETCGRRMNVSSSSEYVAKDGQGRRYATYFCPAYAADGCTNSTRFSEEWLRTQVVDLLKARLFPSDGA